ncbi:MAG: efflux RND transporter periplasmic adaptor subunit [Planctomycetales bacterium]|nr:efflux RND transporter periplasmic adaptor subunit [Planctomycetales bacterium]
MNSSRNYLLRWLWRVLKVGALAIAIAGGIYWLKYSPLPVESHSVGQGPIVSEVMGTGTLEARVQATISPKIADRIGSILVDQGGLVSAGDLLVQLDDEEYQQQVAIAQANLEAATAAVHRLRIDKDRASAVFEQAHRSNNRIQSLIPSNAASQEEADKATELLALAVADVARAEAAITESEKELVTAEKTLEYHRARLADTQIEAPFDGLIVKRSREPGDVVVPGSSILTLISLDELWISAWVDETAMAGLAEQQSARVVYRSEPARSYPGAVVRLGKEADRETREFLVDVRVLKLPDNWAIGQRAEVYIEVARKEQVVRLPANLVVARNDQTGVFVNVQGRARWQPVTLGLHSSDAVEILSGLETDAIVVTPADPLVSLRDGRRISLP